MRPRSVKPASSSSCTLKQRALLEKARQQNLEAAAVGAQLPAQKWAATHLGNLCCLPRARLANYHGHRIVLYSVHNLLGILANRQACSSAPSSTCSAGCKFG